MARIEFSPNFARHVQTPLAQCSGNSLAAVLQGYFASHPDVRSYVLDDQGEVRKHVAIFINNELIQDRARLSDTVTDNDTIFIAQALSGG